MRQRSPLFGPVLAFLVAAIGCGSGSGTEPRRGNELRQLRTDDLRSRLVQSRFDVHQATTASDQADRNLEALLAKVTPALDASQQQAFVRAFEARQDVQRVRGDVLERSKALAEVLDAIEDDPAVARELASVESGALLSAYSTLAATPLAARAIRFAGALLASRAGDGSTIAAVLRERHADLDVRAVKMLADALAAGLVERAVASDGDLDRALLDVRGYLADAQGKVSVLLDAIEDRSALLEQTRAGRAIVVAGADLGPAVRGLGSILAIGAAADAAAKGDLSALVVAGPDAAAALLQATHVLRRSLTGAGRLWATDAAKLAGRIGAGIGVLVTAYETLDGLASLGATDGKVRTVGNCLVLAGTVIALTGGSGALLVAAGTAAKILADVLSPPPPDELTPLLDRLVTANQLERPAAEVLSLAEPRHLAYLGHHLGLSPADVRWVIVRSPGLAASKPNLYETLGALALIQPLDGAGLGSFVKSVASDPNMTNTTVMLSEFLARTSTASKLWRDARSIPSALDALAATARLEQFDDEDYGIPAATQFALTQRAFANAESQLRRRAVPGEVKEKR